jgi:P27 family predicted phage terminase small subunit
MGSRGPKPLPDNVRQLVGAAPRRAGVDLSDGVHPLVEEPEPPPDLTPDATAEWRRIVPELLTLGLLTRIDRGALALYTRSWGRLQVVERDLAAEQARLAAAGESEAAALVHVTPTGFSRPAVLARLAADLAAEVDRYLAAFGMSPSARSRVTASRNAAQGDLFAGGTARFFAD